MTLQEASPFVVENFLRGIKKTVITTSFECVIFSDRHFRSFVLFGLTP